MVTFNASGERAATRTFSIEEVVAEMDALARLLGDARIRPEFKLQCVAGLAKRWSIEMVHAGSLDV